MTQEKKEYFLFLVHELSKIFIYLLISVDVVLAFIILLACNRAKGIVHRLSVLASEHLEYTAQDRLHL